MQHTNRQVFDVVFDKFVHPRLKISLEPGALRLARQAKWKQALKDVSHQSGVSIGKIQTMETGKRRSIDIIELCRVLRAYYYYKDIELVITIKDRKGYAPWAS